ncbi:delta-like protein [Elysia marginata]|uniref:Delta-like protein n=1 Tax=Elysia marginata TaxID=1093978 RepID=A0AAV4JCN5_9GAST|nr:delta-like protein [Elysia marginata]
MILIEKLGVPGLYILMALFHSGDARNNMMVGIWYRNFTNHQGALADGTCCDNPGLTVPNCPSDQCDTEFLPCATFVGGRKCGAFFQTGTATMYDNNSFVLHTRIGTLKAKTPTLIVMLNKYIPGNINFSILAREVTGTSKAPIASFSFIIDWMDTFYSHDDHWRQMILTDAYSELGLHVLHQCARHYFGPTCSKYCKPTYQYTCLNNGSKNCTDGWQGSDCDDLVPYCTSGLCLNGGSCNNIHLGYTCFCHVSYLGPNCETKVTTTTPSRPNTVGITDPLTLTSKPTTSTPNLLLLTTLKSNTAASNPGLYVFNISKNTVSTSIAPTAVSDPAPTVLNISKNTVPTPIVPTAVSDPPRTVLNISKNTVSTSTVPTAVSDPAPTVLNISKNAVSIPTALTVLNISKNTVSTSTVPTAVSDPALTVLNISKNAVSTSTVSTAVSDPPLTVLKISKNTVSTSATLGLFQDYISCVENSKREITSELFCGRGRLFE